MAELFEQLGSNNTKLVEEAKQKFHEQFNQVKESWLLSGVYEFYLSTNSVASMEILINIREPHHNHLFDKLNESIRGTPRKVQALTLLGHVVRKHPTWLYKITQHSLFKEILKLLKHESDILPLVSALLVLIVLLPCIPAFMNPHLQDVFDIFSRLAAWNWKNPCKLVEEQRVHMQVSLYALFQRLYGMFPCNFLMYLRGHYSNKEVGPIFTHTIKPMLQTVQMHPLLVINSSDFETTTERWKKMDAHDVIVECERYSSDLKDRFSHDTCFAPTPFRSRSGTTNSSSFDSPYQLLKLAPCLGQPMECEFFSPSLMILNSQTPPIEASVPTDIPLSHMQGAGQSLVTGVALHSQEGTSPPEAAIEATPETTPIKDTRVLSNRQHMQQTSVARALNTFSARNWGSSNTTTPTHSQPSSPMRKDASSFNFPSDSVYTSAFGPAKKESHANYRLQKLIQDRAQLTDGIINDPTFNKRPMVLAPTSPLRIIPSSSSTNNSISNSPLPVQRIDEPVSQEDEEVLAIVGQGEIAKHASLRQCDSVLHDVDGWKTSDEIEECEQGSPCTSGGLHMPSSKQMTAFRNNMKRLRYHSQCGPDREIIDISTGSSPGMAGPINNMTVRRANSCPEMKKEVVMTSKDNINKMVEENEDEMNHDQLWQSTMDMADRELNGFGQTEIKKNRCMNLITTETQTENIWPMPYEHLFFRIFPSLGNTEVKPSPAPSPAPFNPQPEKYTTASFYDILDRYVYLAYQTNEKDSVKNIKDQLQLLHQQLLFERHRRETHALRNRTLFTDVTKNKVLEEHNSALTDQVRLQEKHIDELSKEIEKYRRDEHSREKAALDTANYWETKYCAMETEWHTLREKTDDLHAALNLERLKAQQLNDKWQTAEASNLDVEAEVRIAREQVLAGEKGRAELIHVNRELLLAGEVIMKYQERISDLNIQRKSDQELSKLSDVYQHEIRILQQQNESKVAMLEASRTRISELEHKILELDDFCSNQKKNINDLKEECHEKLKAVESKYTTQLAINRTLEERILEMFQQIETAGRQAVHSPDTSSCHEVNATMTDRTSTAAGLSPHSSPLSASLGSTEGNIGWHSDARDVRNLQMLVDENEPQLHRSSSTTESDLCLDAPSSSQAHTSKND